MPKIGVVQESVRKKIKIGNEIEDTQREKNENLSKKERKKFKKGNKNKKKEAKKKNGRIHFDYHL